MNALLRAGIAVIAAVLLYAAPAGAAKWDKDYFPNYTVLDQDGNSYKFYDDLVRGKIVVANFVYTTCTDICGLSTARMSEVVENMGDRMGRDVFVYSITLTPEIDTPETLKKFATAFGEVAGWKFLTGEPTEMKELRWKLGERSRFLGEHRSDMVAGNDSTGYWRRISLMGNLGSVTEAVLRLDPQYTKSRHRVARLGTQKSYVISNRTGEALFMKGCSGCHNVGGGDGIGPDLYGVTWTREREWLMRVLLDPDKLRRENDTLFTEIDARFPGVLMPDLDLSETDAKDVLEYLERRSTETSESKPAQHHNREQHNHSHQNHENHGHETHNHEHDEPHQRNQTHEAGTLEGSQGAAKHAVNSGVQPNG